MLNLFGGWHFLTHNCPIDLSGDEAQYWTWSRQLDWSYYSKGPLIAYLIRGSCTLLGNTMPAVRAPALVLAAGTSVCTYWLTRKLFGSDRLALGTFVLGGVVPLYLAGGTLMTIDSPFFFCWAATTCFAAKAIWDRAAWAWVAAGVFVGLGFLAKYAMLLWLPSLFLFLLVDRRGRSGWIWATTIIPLVMTTPVIVWNARHGWASLHHVATQTGTNTTGGFWRGNLLEFVGTQIGLINPALAVVLGAAVVHTVRDRGRDDPARGQRVFLICIGLPFFALCLLDSLRTKVQANWPAPAYFTLLILVAAFLGSHLKTWRGWLIGAVVFGGVVQLLLSGQSVLYPAAAWVDRRYPRAPGPGGQPRLRITPSNFDPMFKLRGIADPFASTVSAAFHQLPPGSFILCEDYQDASQLSFYVQGQPKTYFVGSYWTDPIKRRRFTQYDMWPDRRLDQPGLIGRDAIYIGTIYYEPLRASFDSIEKVTAVVVRRDGLPIRSFEVWRCHGFHGIHRPAGSGSF